MQYVVDMPAPNEWFQASDISISELSKILVDRILRAALQFSSKFVVEK